MPNPILCIGGPLDGEWQDCVSDHAQEAIQNLRVSVGPEKDVAVYDRECITASGQSFPFWLWRGMTKIEAVKRLLEGYSKK